VVLDVAGMVPHDAITEHMTMLRELQRVINAKIPTFRVSHNPYDIFDVEPDQASNATSTDISLDIEGTSVGVGDSWFCPKDEWDPETWAKEYTDDIADATSCQGPMTCPLQTDRRYYCDKFPQDSRPFVPPTRYTKNDLVVGIYTGESVVYSRGMAVMDTWLNDLPNTVIYTPTPDPTVPSVGIAGMKPDYEYMMNAQLVQLRGLQDMYRRFPDKKWYYIVGCDTYLNVDNALRMLESYDASQPYWVSKNRFPVEPFPDDINTTDFPLLNITGANHSRGFTWSSGSWGWFLSNSVVKAYVDALDAFLDRYPKHIDIFCYCPDKVTGALLSLLGFDITEMTPDWEKTYDSCAVDSRMGFAYKTLDWSLAHFVRPRKMLAMHERMMHEKVDRMYAANMNMTQWSSDFAALHAQTWVRKRGQLRKLGLMPSKNAHIAKTSEGGGGPT
jgi:hypothetical protein